MRLIPLKPEEFAELAEPVTLPVEQSPAWDAYDRLIAGRNPWQRFACYRDSQLVALIALTQYQGRGFRYLWARQGPVWFVAPTHELEEALRQRLAAGVRHADPGVVFVRLHAHHPNEKLHPLLQSVTYDRTVIVELADRSDEEILAQMKKRGRRDLRKGIREQPVEVTEATGIDEAGFAQLYRVLEETAERDAFGAHPQQTYTALLEALGPKIARLFVARHAGQVQAWALITVYDGACTVYYAASTETGRRHDAPTQLYWRIIQQLRDEGVASFDLMGIGSAIAPSLEALTTMKTKFNPEVTEVAPAWDYPLHPLTYQGLRVALRTKRVTIASARTTLAGLRTGLRRLSSVVGRPGQERTS